MYKLTLISFVSTICLTLGSKCEEFGNKFQCNQYECGWYRGECVPCVDVKVQHRCIGLCVWDEIDNSCDVTPTESPTLPPTVPCEEHDNMEKCVELGCNWNKKNKTCKDVRPCNKVKSKKVCKHREDCVLGDKNKCVNT